MTSARVFCRETEFSTTIFLTYTFDPLFFERVPLADLGIGGTRRILIAADSQQTTEAIRRCIQQVAHLGRRYVVGETVDVGTFHPKLIARLSDSSGRVWLGSGNLTQAGWGANREVATSWSIGPGHDDAGGWLRELLNAVQQAVRSRTFADQIKTVLRETAWLESAPEAALPPVLIGRPEAALAPQLARRWRGRRFDELRLCTGSTDVKGSFLVWAHQTFGIGKAILCLDPATSSFDPKAIEALPISVEIICPPTEQPMHAKLFWFSSDTDCAAVVGSANCSAAAWFGRNFELIAVYDQPTAASFAELLHAFKRPKSVPLSVLGQAPLEAVEQPAAVQYRLVSLRVRSTRFVDALVEPSLAEDAKPSLIIRNAGQAEPVEMIRRGEAWVGALGKEMRAGALTLFAHLEWTMDGERFETEPRWIDNEDLLERAARQPQPDSSLVNIATDALRSRDSQRILDAVRSITESLITPDREASSASGAMGVRIGQPRRHADEEPGSTQPVDPSAMVRSLRELHAEPLALLKHGTGSRELGLSGILSLLFSKETEEEELDLRREADSEAAMPRRSDRPQGPASDKDPDGPARPFKAPDERIELQRLLRGLFAALSKPSFAEHCSAQRLVDALALPLLICISGRLQGWMTPTEAGSQAWNVAKLMFHHSYGKGLPNGLLKLVLGRAASEDDAVELQKALGKGSLWVTLMAALAPDSQMPQHLLLRLASTTSKALAFGPLLAHADAPGLSSLVQRSIDPRAEAFILSRASDISSAADHLAEALTRHWGELYKQQGSGSRLRPVGTLLWNPDFGWEFTPPTPAEAYWPGYIDLKRAMLDRAEIGSAVEAVESICRWPLPIPLEGQTGGVDAS